MDEADISDRKSKGQYFTTKDLKDKSLKNITIDIKNITFSKSNNDYTNDISYGASFVIPPDSVGRIKLEMTTTVTSQNTSQVNDLSYIFNISNKIIAGADPLIKH